MTPDQKLAAIANILGVPSNAAARWWHATGLPPTTPLANLNDEAELKRYAAFGFRPDLSRGIAPSDLPHMIEICDRLGAPDQTATGAESVISRAGHFPTDVAIYLVMTGCTQGFSPFLTPTIFAPDAVQTIPDAGQFAINKWTGGAGPGIG